VNAEQIDDLIWDTCLITVCEFAEIVEVSVSTVKTVIYNDLDCGKESVRWVPKLLASEPK